MASQGYVRFPTIWGDAIVLTAEDDLWRVSLDGGRAERLTAGVAEASHARFSPDGTLLAFTGRDEGATETYVMPTAGGPAQRLTYEGEATYVAGWRPDGSAILYVSAAHQPSRRMRVLHEVAPGGATPPRALPYGIAHSIAFGPGGALVLGRHTAEPARWKRYRGGTAGHLWIDPSGSGQFQRLLDLAGNVSSPCWVGGRVYFISDHEGMGNIYSCLPDGGDLRRQTHHQDYYARGLSTDGQRLVYHAGGDLYLLHPNATESTRLAVELATARAQRARKFVPAQQYMDSWMPHPKGRAVALTTRGKAFSMGNWEGATLQHGDPDGTRYRHIVWLADGKRLAAVSDTGTEPRLAVFSADGVEPSRVLEDADIGHVTELAASPVGEVVALRNHRSEILLVDVATGTTRRLDHTPYGRGEMANRGRGLAWAPDGRWLAYALGISPQQVAIKLCRVETGETWQITEPVLYDTRPAFDPAGRYLYFLGARDFDPVADNLSFEWSFPKGLRPYLITLRRDLRSPFVPTPEPPKDEFAEKLELAKKDEQAGQQRPAPVEIDLEGITTRIVAFPVAEGNYGRVQGTHEGAVFSSFPIEGTRKQDHWNVLVPTANGAIEGYHFESHKQERLVESVSDFIVTSDGKFLLYRAGERLRALKAGEKPPESDAGDGDDEKPGRNSGWLDLDRVKVSIRPEIEWRQMFAEAWRLQREQFWTPDMGGVDWQRAYDRYAPLVERVGSRAELSDLFWELQGELGSSHAYEIGGEYREQPHYVQGYLGVDWAFDPASGHYTIARIVRGDPWDAEATSPLLAPGVNAAIGDVILAVNGQRVTAERGPQQLLVNQAGQEVQLTIASSSAAGGEGSQEARAVTVRAIGDEHPARYRDWVEANRRAVHRATNGRVGYLHIPDMAYDGFAEFHRYYLQEYDHEGLIVDVRWNGGGMVSQLVLEKLMRPRLGYGFQRWGAPEPYFIESPRGALVAITDENAGSDGDIVSHAFKMLKLGPLVGKRTWGGVIGIDPYIPLADGTLTTQPEFSFWFTDVGWGVENYGTDPTIEVEYPPHAYVAGQDPQLERGIAEALRLIAERPAQTPTPGPHPSRAWPKRS
ncbi:MAG: PDZ domain-containing protein [Ktedonobacterales bacterium]|nr:PDZ domain-containing protein [Ktedonobacterales bacterium]